MCTVCSVSDMHCKENPIYVFLFWELRGLSPNFHIQVSVSDLYISCSRIGRSIVEIYNRSQTYECGNCGNVAVQLLFWEYMFQFSVLCSGLGNDNSQ
jgi:hypothetical protein